MLQSPARPFVWDPECQQAFGQVREALLAIATLFHLHSERDTRLETDALDGVIAGVFSQKHPDSKWCPVAFYSHCLTGAELNWEIHDKELFAIVTAFAKWKAELASVQNQIEVLLDHQSLEYFMTTKVLNSRQVRWAEDLAWFNYRITYTPGKDNARADILSRREQDMENLRTAQVDNQSRVLLGPHQLHPQINAKLATAYIAHTRIQVVRLSVLESVEKVMSLDYLQLIEVLLQENRISFIQERAVLPKQYRIQDGLLLFGDRLCVTANSPLCTCLICKVHNQVSTAHPSATKTYQLLAQKYHWKGMEATCKRYVRNCSACCRAHPRQTRIPGLIHPLPIPE
jgi:hypothetical protein